MSGDSETETETQTRLSPELRGASNRALQGAEDLYNQGTQGFYKGSRLTDLDPLVRQAQERQLALAGQGGDLSNMVGRQQDAFGNLLDAGNLEGNSLFQRQVDDALTNANLSFQRGSVPLMQQATAAGQYGSSEGQEGLALLGGEVNRNMQQAITQAALGGQQVALSAQGLAPQSIGLGLLPSEIEQNVGAQRTQRSQAELQDHIQQQEIERRLQSQVQAEFQNYLSSNPLINESDSTTTQTQSSSGLQTALGVASIGADLYTGGAFSGLGGMMGGIFGGGAATPTTSFGGIGPLRSMGGSVPNPSTQPNYLNNVLGGINTYAV